MRHIKHKLLGVAMLMLGAAAISASTGSVPAVFSGFRHAAALGAAIGATLMAAGAMILATAFSGGGKSAALMRLDHFLPFLRKKKKADELRSPALPVRIAARVLPSAWFADRVTGRPGAIRKLLKRLGPSVLSSPVRRVVQAVCFLAFLWLFFYVCWPYSAQPETNSRTSPGWRLSDVDAESVNLRLSDAKPSDWNWTAGETVHLVDARAVDAIRGELGSFTIVRGGQTGVVLKPVEPLTDSQIDRLLTGVGTWTLHERSPWPRHYTEDLARKEALPADLFLVIDPLVSLSTAIASRSWVWSLVCAAIILTVCVLVPRGFCGYLCPLGTLIDLFDWAVSGRVQRFRVPEDGWWVHIKYYLLLGTLVCAMGGVLISGFVAAIPVITRGMLFIGEPLQSGALRGWNQVPPLNAGHFVSIAMFLAVLGLGLLRPRFWCKYVCPSGAVFSVGNLFRATERKVESTCINCNKCVEICPFDAIKPDFTTRVTDCTLCQTCAGVCPTHAIKFVERGNLVELKVEDDPPTGEMAIGRRGFVSLAAGTAAAVVGGIGMTAVTKTFGARVGEADVKPLVRPPGSVPEQPFLQMCIRCGECFKACPYNVLQPVAFEQGLEGLWTPKVVADHAGCAPSCNACGQVCPTGAIRALPLEEKKVARMGLAIVNEQTCLPIAGREACQWCVDECAAAGYHAIEFTRVHTQTDEDGRPIEDSGFLAPVILADQCVGCGLCQMSCYNVNVFQRRVLDESAIVIEAGAGKEDRLLRGSYRELRRSEDRRRRAALQQRNATTNDYFVPDDDPSVVMPQEDESPFGPDATLVPTDPATDDDPFGIQSP